jgi:energy-coupling factor transport system ATP-binding protein
VKHLNGILRPTTGDVLINGDSINTRSTARWSAYVGYMFQNPDDQLFLDTVRKELEFGPRRLKMEESKVEEMVAYAAEVCGLQDSLEKHPFDLTPAQKKFCAIASIISMNPEVFILDEPTCGQDVRGTHKLESIIEALRQRGKLCITISHDMKFVVKNFQRVIVLCNGRAILDAPTAEAFNEVETLASSYVSPPPLTRVGQAAGFGRAIFNLPDFVKECEQRRQKATDQATSGQA